MKIYHQSISVIFPAYNEEKNIAHVVREAHSFCAKNFPDFEIIVVDDGSTDKTGEIVKKLQEQKKQIKLIANKKNLGYGATVWKGLKEAKKQLIFFSDADRQFDIRELSKVLHLIEMHDVVIGYRRLRKDKLIRKINSWGWKVTIFAMLGLIIKDIDCAFKLFRRKVVDEIKISSTGATFSAELIYKIKEAGFGVIEVPVGHFPRLEGKPTGAKISVIVKAFRELWRFYIRQKKLVRSRSIVMYGLGIAALFFSRVLLMSNSLDFFDSGEYAWRVADPSVINSMASGHPPFHPLYAFFGWIIKQLSGGSEIFSLELTSVITGTLSIIFLFLFIRKVWGSRVAWLASAFYALAPFVFVSQTTVLVDASEHVFYFLSLYLFLIAIEKQEQGRLVGFLAGVSMGLAAFAHTQVAIWTLPVLTLPLAFSIKFDKPRLIDFVYKLVLFALGGSIFIALYVWLLVYAKTLGFADFATSPLQALNYLVLGNISDRDSIEVLKVVYYLAVIGSTLLSVLAVLGAFKLLKANKRQLLFLLLWFLPFVIGSTYIYENLYGRTLILGLVPIMVLSSYFILNAKKIGLALAVIVFLQLGLLVIPVVRAYQQPAPIEKIKEMFRNEPEGGVFISSNVTRTLANAAYKGEFVSFGDVGYGAGYVKGKIDEAISQNRPVYILSDAIIFPYHRFDGAFHDIRSTDPDNSSEHTTLLDNVFANYSLSLLEVDEGSLDRALYKVTSSRQDDLSKNIELAKKQNLVFGRIKSSEPASGVIVNDYSGMFCGASAADISRLDFGLCLVRSGKPQLARHWTFTDKDGVFSMTTQNAQDDDISFASNPSLLRSRAISSGFAKDGDLAVSKQLVGIFEDASKLQDEIQKLDSYMVITERKSNQVSLMLYKLDVKIDSVQTIAAKHLGGEKSRIINDRSSDVSSVRQAVGTKGAILSGPYMNLDPGKYKAIYSVRSTAASTRPAKFKITSGAGSKILAELSKDERELNSAKYQDIEVGFDQNEKIEQLEFMIEVEEGSTLRVQSVTLER